jgi:anti-anti-sigma factor
VTHHVDRRDQPSTEDLLRVSARPVDRRGRVVLHVAGRIDPYTVPLLQSCLDTHATRRGVRELVVDMEEVTSLGRDGGEALARARRRCLLRGARLRVRCSSRQAVRSSLELAGLAELLSPRPAPTGAPRGVLVSRHVAGQPGTRSCHWRTQERP